jgi:mono/diheme cytochrome c family protein
MISTLRMPRSALHSRSCAPRAWARLAVEAAAGKRAADVGAVAFDLGGRVGVLRPIPVGPACVACHGAPEAFPGELRDALAAAYPGDRATGFREGDLRGFFWAEAGRPK